MSGIALIILNAVLAVAAIGSTVMISQRSKPAPLVLEESSEKDSAKAKNNAESDRKESATTNKSSEPRLSTADYDDLWRMTLFLPTRAEAEPSEDPEEAAAAEAAALAAQNIEFELIGIASIAQVGQEPQPVAILRNKATGARRNNSRNQPKNRRSNTRESANKEIAVLSDPTGQYRREVFRVGDKINLTGYTLKSIDMEARKVVVVRGSESVTLSINFTSSEATSRRDSATAAAQKKREERNKEELATAKRIADEREQLNNPGQPPPPPGATGNDFPANNTAEQQRARHPDQAQSSSKQNSSGTQARPGSSGPANNNTTIRQSMQERIERDRNNNNKRNK
jgi:hypothetical protein